MAKKPITPAPKAAAPKVPTRATTPSAPPVSSPVRNSPVPKAQGAPKAITHEMIAKRAYEISQSPQCGSEYDNWVRAERELRGA